MPIFFSSAPWTDAGEGALHQKRGELLAADLGEDREQIGRAAVGDPHLLAVEDVVRAVGAEVGAGAGGQRIGAGVRLGEAVGGQHLRVGQLGQVLAASAASVPK